MNICAQLKMERKDFSLDMTLSFPKGKITALLGPSGSGKTTLLRLLAGLEKATQGEISCAGETWFDKEKKIDIAIQQRKIGFVFQDYALFSHLTVAENIIYGVPRHQRCGVLYKWLKKLDLEAYEHKYPHELSGGQRQRVALGRALAIEPKLLLLDEPFSALDVDLRSQLQTELSKYLKDVNCPIVLVTHDIAEAKRLADFVYIVNEGKILRSGEVEAVFNNPSSYLAARTLGWQNFLSIKGVEGNTVYGPWGVYNMDHVVEHHTSHLAFQPQHVRINNGETLNGISAVVKEVRDCGPYREIIVECDGDEDIKVHRFWDEPVPAPGSSVTLNISTSHMHSLSMDSQHIESIDKECKFQRRA